MKKIKIYHHLRPLPKNNDHFVFVLYLLVYKKLRKKCCLLDLLSFFSTNNHTHHIKRDTSIYKYIYPI